MEVAAEVVERVRADIVRLRVALFNDLVMAGATPAEAIDILDEDHPLGKANPG